MNIEKYTERSRGFIQSAQSLATREGHQQFTPEHILKVLLDDEEGLAAGLIDRRADARARRCTQTEAALAKLPQGRGLRRGPALSRARDRAAVRQRRADRAEGRRQLRHRRAAAARPGDGEGHATRRKFWPTPA